MPSLPRRFTASSTPAPSRRPSRPEALPHPCFRAAAPIRQATESFGSKAAGGVTSRIGSVHAPLRSESAHTRSGFGLNPLAGCSGRSPSACINASTRRIGSCPEVHQRSGQHRALSNTRTKNRPPGHGFLPGLAMTLRTVDRAGRTSPTCAHLSAAMLTGDCLTVLRP